MGKSPSECLVLEDSQNGTTAAHRAECQSSRFQQGNGAGGFFPGDQYHPLSDGTFRNQESYSITPVS
ncbi:MAG: hypothetical protein ACLT38_01650 [Akkermansia sp.]